LAAARRYANLVSEDVILRSEAMGQLGFFDAEKTPLLRDPTPRIIEETLVAGAVVSKAARRHGLSPQQLFTWRRQARRPGAESAGAEGPNFVPAVVDAAPAEGAVVRRERKRARRADRTSGVIEVEIAGVTVRVGRGAEAKTVAAVLRALRGGA
jgi:transposase